MACKTNFSFIVYYFGFSIKLIPSLDEVLYMVVKSDHVALVFIFSSLAPKFPTPNCTSGKRVPGKRKRLLFGD